MALAAFAVLGCVPVPAAVYAQHATLHGCDAGKIQAWAVDADVVQRLDLVQPYRAKGCGYEDIYYCRSNACRTPRKVVLDRHAAEFECARGEVEVRSLGGGAWLAEGCGRRRTYNCGWSTGDLRCIAETDSRE